MNKKSKEIIDSYWWLSPEIEWNSIGASVISRPTEIQAFNNIGQQADYIRKVGFREQDIYLTKLEERIYKLDLEVNKSSFDYKKHGVYLKDSPVRKISKITGYSENFIMSKLSNISRKVYLQYIFFGV